MRIMYGQSLNEVMLDFFTAIARDDLKQRSHRKPTDRQVADLVEKWIAEGVLGVLFREAAAIYQKSNQHWNPPGLENFLIRFFQENTPIERKRGRPTQKRQLIGKWPIVQAMAKGQTKRRKQELDFLRSIYKPYLNYVEIAFAVQETKDQIQFGMREDVALKKFGTLPAWKQYKADKRIDTSGRVPKHTLDYFMEEYGIAKELRPALAMRFSRARRGRGKL